MLDFQSRHSSVRVSVNEAAYDNELCFELLTYQMLTFTAASAGMNSPSCWRGWTLLPLYPFLRNIRDSASPPPRVSLSKHYDIAYISVRFGCKWSSEPELNDHSR